MTVSSVSAESAFLAGAVCAEAMLAATATGIAHNTVTMRLLAIALISMGTEDFKQQNHRDTDPAHRETAKKAICANMNLRRASQPHRCRGAGRRLRTNVASTPCRASARRGAPAANAPENR